MSFPKNKSQHYIYILLHVITTVVAFTTSPSTSITKLSNRNNNYTRNKCIVYKSSSRGGGDSDKSNKDENNKDNNNNDDDPERNNRNNLDHLSRYESLIQGDYDLSRFPNPLMDPMRDYRHDSSMDNKNIRFGRDFEDDGRRHHHHPMNHPMQGQGPNHHHHPMDHPMHMHDGPNNNHHPMNHPMQGQGPNNHHHPMIDHPMHMHDGPETYINNDGYHNNNDRFDNHPMNQHNNDRNSDNYISTLQRRLKEAEMSKHVQRRMYEGPQMKGSKNTNRNNRFNVRPSMNRGPMMDSGFDRFNRGNEQRVGDNDNLTPFGSEYIDNRDLNQRRSMNLGRRGGGAREGFMDERRAMNPGRRGGDAREGLMDERRAMNHGRRGGARGGLMDERRAMNPGRRGGGAREELMDERYIRHLEAKIDEHESRMNKSHGHPHNYFNRRNAPPPFFGRGSNNGYGSSYGGNHYHGR